MSHQCSTCNKSYSTSSHLARHNITHQPDRQFQCPFCSKRHTRQDIARRHAERCSKRQGRPVTKSSGRGQPRKACDRCASTKLSCDKTSPCTACVKASFQCSHTRLQTCLTATNASGYPLGVPEVSNEKSMGETTRVPFFLSYATAQPGDPKDFAQALETLKEASNGTTADEELDRNQVFSQAIPMFVPFFPAELFHYDVPHESYSSDIITQGLHTPDLYDEIFRRRAGELIHLVENAGRTASRPPSDTVAMLLTPGNLALCVESFFRNAYRHVPIVHPPSFSSTSAELPLLLGVFVVGAVWSYPRDTYFMVLDIVELIEECIFGGNDFQELLDPIPEGSRTTSPRMLSLLQAATMLVSISFAFPNLVHRRRFREQRFSDLISAIRLLQGDGTISRLTKLTEAATSFDWKEYIVKESYNRVIYYTYLLDCHISILHATLPRLSVVEMKASLPSNESAFGSTDAETCLDKLKSL
ncbi:hypothetical protein C7974DRAFT_389401, partial [Boeremia exigua]|uniref:uncharacterized protein n=1 Tax=Boeremia exigua TaxID=749465 RepID=UPI001E8CFD85